MKATVGDKLLVKGSRVGDPDRNGVIIQVRGANGEPPYQVRWGDGRETSFFPSSDCLIVPPQASAPHLESRPGASWLR